MLKPGILCKNTRCKNTPAEYKFQTITDPPSNRRSRDDWQGCILKGGYLVPSFQRTSWRIRVANTFATLRSPYRSFVQLYFIFSSRCNFSKCEVKTTQPDSFSQFNLWCPECIPNTNNWWDCAKEKFAQNCPKLLLALTLSKVTSNKLPLSSTWGNFFLRARKGQQFNGRFFHLETG